MHIIFTRSQDTESVVKILRSANREISYETLAAATNLTIPRLKSLLPSARRILLKEKISFGTIRSFGLSRLDDSGKATKSEDDKKKVGRAAKRGLKNIESIETFDRLGTREQLVVSTNRTIFSLTLNHSRTTPQPPKETAVPETNEAAARIVRLQKDR
jgi:hypothetical protein